MAPRSAASMTMGLRPTILRGRVGPRARALDREAAAPRKSAPPSGPSVDAVVKWFKGEKGFGFVELSNGAGDAFLHIGTLQAAGYDSVPPGAKLKVNVGNGVKGAQVTRVLEVDTTGAAERVPPSLAGLAIHLARNAAPPILRPRFRSPGR